MTRAAWLLGALAACGGSGDTGPATVTVTDSSTGARVAGATVHFQRADSTLLATVKTGGDGIARADVEPGAFASVVDVFTEDGIQVASVYTVAGVQPGDALAVRVARPVEALPTVSVKLFVPAATPVTSQFVVHTTCGEPFHIGDVTTSGGVQSVAVDLVVCAPVIDLELETIVFHPTNAIVVRDATLSDNAGFEAPALEPVRLVQPRFVHPRNNVQPGSMSFELATPHGPLLSRDSTDNVLEVPVPAGDFAFVETEWLGGAGHHIAWGPSVVDEPTYDLAGTFPLTELDPAWSDDLRGVAWPVEAATVQADIAFAKLQFQGYHWSVVGPFDGAGLALPTLPPTDGVPLDPSTDPQAIQGAGFATAAGGYDSLRATALAKPFRHAIIAGDTGEAFTMEWCGNGDCL